MRSAGALADFRAWEIAVSALFALAMPAVLAGAGAAIHSARADRKAPHHEVDVELPVRVVPVIERDAPLLALGGERRSALPDRAASPVPSPRVERRAFPSPKAGKAAEDAPPPEVPLADAGAEPPPPDAALALQVDTPVVATDAGAPNMDQPGSSDGVRGGTEPDPLKARAVDLYRARIAAWFSARFRVSRSGLSQTDLLRYHVSATVDVGADRVVTGYSLVPSGSAAFDAAARAALEGARGSAIPPPPPNYPGVEQRKIHVTFVCKENRCD